MDDEHHRVPAGDGHVLLHRRGETTSMNTVIRMIGGAVGTQVVSALIAGHQHNGYPALSGFTQSYVAEAAFLILAAIAALLAGQGQQARS
jgi:hypothetical protein